MKPTVAILCLFFAVVTMPVIAYAGHASSSGASASKVKSNDIVVTKKLNTSSPNLYRGETSGAPKAPTASKNSR